MKNAPNSSDLLKQSLKNLEVLLQSIPSQKWSATPKIGLWSVAEIIHHLILVEVKGLHDLKDIVEGRQDSIAIDSTYSPNLDQIKHHQTKLKTIAAYQPSVGIPSEYLLDGMRRARRETIEFTQKVGAQRLGSFGIRTLWVGVVNGSEYIECLANHMTRHMEQIKQAAA